MTETPIRRSRDSLRIDHPHGRTATISVDGRTVSYHDIGGDGPTLILAHATGGSYVRWQPLLSVLSKRYRVVTPQLLGYGRLEAPAADMRLHPWSDCSVLLALAEDTGEPVHLVGHAYGGTVALETARALGKRARSLTLVEPIGFHLLRLSSHEREWHEIPTYRRLDTPTRLIVGQSTPAPARAIMDELLRVLPDSHLRILPRAGHMSPLTHPRELAALVAEHVDCVEGHCDPDRDDSPPEREHRRSIA